MTSPYECAKCGADISDTYQGYDPSVGIMGAGWYCEACDKYYDDDRDDSDFLDLERERL